MLMMKSLAQVVAAHGIRVNGIALGAVITLLAICGLTHRQSYGDIFAITLISTSAVFVVIALFYLAGIV